MHSNDAPNGVKKLHAPFKPPLLSSCQMEGTNARSPGTKILKILRCVWMTLLGCKVPLSGQEPCFTIINTPYLTTGIGKILCNYKLEDHNNTFSLQQISGFSTFDRISRGGESHLSAYMCMTCVYTPAHTITRSTRALLLVRRPRQEGVLIPGQGQQAEERQDDSHCY